jgi:hypothetical protein
MNPQQLAPLLAWVAAKYAEELDAALLQAPPEDLWGRHIIWLFLLTKPDGVDPRDPEAIKVFLGTIPDDLMAPARQIFLEAIAQRQALL